MKPPSLRTLAITLPIVFACHVAEETPHFVEWFNHLATPGISQASFLAVNATAFVITLVVSGLVATSRTVASAFLAVAWVGFLMLANGLFHVIATIAHGLYSPGVITGTLLYLPLSFLVMRAAVRECAVSWTSVVLVALLGGVPMFIHGYMIVFQGSRFF